MASLLPALGYGFGPTPAQLKLIAEFDNLGNPAYMARKTNAGLLNLEHFEIPLSVLQGLNTQNIPEEIRNELIFLKNGVFYFRWIINPHESSLTQEVLDHYFAAFLNYEKMALDHPQLTMASEMTTWLKSKNLDAKRYHRFTGYLFSSRSFSVISPDGTVTFGAKTSTKWIHGIRDNKQVRSYPAREALGEGEIHAYLQNRIGDLNSEHMSYLPEPLHVAVLETVDVMRWNYTGTEQTLVNTPIFDQSFSVRLLTPIGAKKGLLTLSAFSVLHEDYGLRLAKANGEESDPNRFVDRVFFALGQAVYEYLIRTGLSSDSLHLQNFRLEVDDQLKWTGRIVFNDVGDTYIWIQYFEKIGHDTSKMRWLDGPKFEDSPIVRLYEVLSKQHRIKLPSWLRRTMKDIRRQFNNGYTNQSETMAGPSREKLKGKYLDEYIFDFLDRESALKKRDSPQLLHSGRTIRCALLF